MAGVKVGVVDASGNAQEAQVFADGRRLGDAPGTLTVPMCTKELEVRAGDFGWKGPLSLREREVTEVHATLARLGPEPQPRGELTLTVDWKRSRLGENPTGTAFFLENDRVRLPCTSVDRSSCAFTELVPGSWRFVTAGGMDSARRLDLTGSGRLELDGGKAISTTAVVLSGVGLASMGFGLQGARMLQLEPTVSLGALVLAIGGGLLGLGTCAGGFNLVLDGGGYENLGFEGDDQVYVAWDPLHEREAWSVSAIHQGGFLSGVMGTRRFLSQLGVSVLVGYPGIGVGFGLIGPARTSSVLFEVEAMLPLVADAAGERAPRIVGTMGYLAWLGSGVALRFGVLIGVDFTVAGRASGDVFVPLMGPALGVTYQL
jgi:hypothetical protein